MLHALSNASNISRPCVYTHKMSNKMQHEYLDFIKKSLFMFRVLSVPIIRSTITAVDNHWYNICHVGS
jgi:hypothetical protein